MARIVYRAVQCGVLIICTAPLYAQAPDAATSGQPASTGGEAARAITLTEVEAALAAVESDIQLDDAVKNVLRAKYQQAIAALLEAESLNSKAAEYRDSLQSAPKRAAELRGELQALPAAKFVADLPEMDDPAELQRELDLRRITLDEAREESVRKTLEVNLIGHRPVEINSRIPQIERNLREIREELSSPELAPSVKSPSRIAERTLLLAQQLRLSNERKKLEQELSSLAAREDLLKAEQDLLRQQVTLASSAVDALDSLLYERLDNQAREFLARVESLSEDLAERDVATTGLVVESQELAREYDHVIRHLQSLEAARRDVSDLLQTLEAEYSSLQEQRELSGAGVSTVQGIYSLQRRALTARIDVETTGLPALDEMRLASLQIREKLDRQIEVEQALSLIHI